MGSAPIWLLGWGAIRRRKELVKETNALAAERLNFEREEKERIERSRKAFLDSLSDWPVKANCKIEKRRCAALINANSTALRFITFSENGEPLIERVFQIAVKSIISMGMERPEIVTTVSDIQYVPVTIQKQKRPITRAVVGGALFGPVGAVVGAVSGVGGRIETKVEAHRTTRRKTLLGSSQLVLGTSDPNHICVKIEFDPVKLAEEWWYRIQAAQSPKR
jgi:hypothetical protein